MYIHPPGRSVSLAARRSAVRVVDVFEHHSQGDRIERLLRHRRMRQSPLDDPQPVLRSRSGRRVRAEIHADRVPAALAHLGRECAGAASVVHQLPPGFSGIRSDKRALAAAHDRVAQTSQYPAPPAPAAAGKVSNPGDREDRYGRGVRARIQEDERARAALAEPILAAIVPRRRGGTRRRPRLRRAGTQRSPSVISWAGMRHDSRAEIANRPRGRLSLYRRRDRPQRSTKGTKEVSFSCAFYLFS